MCKLFIQADPELWRSATHSLRIDGMVTSVRMENYFWHILEEIARRDGMNTAQMITRLYHESIDAGHDLGNFTSFLRVCALRYQALQLTRAALVPTSLVPIRDAERISTCTPFSVSVKRMTTSSSKPNQRVVAVASI